MCVCSFACVCVCKNSFSFSKESHHSIDKCEFLWILNCDQSYRREKTFPKKKTSLYCEWIYKSSRTIFSSVIESYLEFCFDKNSKYYSQRNLGSLWKLQTLCLSHFSNFNHLFCFHAKFLICVISKVTKILNFNCDAVVIKPKMKYLI